MHCSREASQLSSAAVLLRQCCDPLQQASLLPVDAGVDVNVDAGVHVGVDAIVHVGVDAGVDADVGYAVGVDTYPDAGDSADVAVDGCKLDVNSTWHSRVCGSMQLKGCADARKSCYIQVGMPPPQLLIIYLHQPALHMPMLHYELCQQLHTSMHILHLLPYDKPTSQAM